MNIPSYNVIYKTPDGRPNPPDKTCPPQAGSKYNNRFQLSYVRDTSKNVDIYDKFGRLRYVVELASSLESPGERGYRVTVA